MKMPIGMTLMLALTGSIASAQSPCPDHRCMAAVASDLVYGSIAGDAQEEDREASPGLSRLEAIVGIPRATPWFLLLTDKSFVQSARDVVAASGFNARIYTFSQARLNVLAFRGSNSPDARKARWDDWMLTDIPLFLDMVPGLSWRVDPAIELLSTARLVVDPFVQLLRTGKWRLMPPRPLSMLLTGQGPIQYRLAQYITEATALQNGGRTRLVLAGHSLGGGLATFAWLGARRHMPTGSVWTFNTARLPRHYGDRTSLRPEAIRNHRVVGDLVSMAGPTPSLGTDIFLPYIGTCARDDKQILDKVTANPLDAHDMATVIRGILTGRSSVGSVSSGRTVSRSFGELRDYLACIVTQTVAIAIDRFLIYAIVFVLIRGLIFMVIGPSDSAYKFAGCLILALLVISAPVWLRSVSLQLDPLTTAGIVVLFVAVVLSRLSLYALATAVLLVAVIPDAVRACRAQDAQRRGLPVVADCVR